MAKIKLHNDTQNSATSVSNIFIDEYMSDANGEFVKIYLYLLRLMNAPDTSFSISSIADKFEHTEKDIKRALSYWERMELLRLEYDNEENLTGIYLLQSPSRRADKIFEEAIAPDDGSTSAEDASATASGISDVPAKKSYSADDIQHFRENDAVAELFFITERYLNRTLNATDINTILYLYDALGFSTDLIEYLIEYCVSKGHTSIRYIEKVALAWSQSNIATVTDAKQAASLHSQSYFMVVRALGISGRNLVPSETAMIEKWRSEYGFTNELIEEACKRTISTIHQPSFEYTDSILTKWHKKNITNLMEVARLDEEHQNRKKVSAAPAAANPSSKNKFNNFSQRSYDYDQLEKMLLTTNAH